MNEVSPLRRSAAFDQLLSDGWLADIHWLSEIDSTNSFLKRALVADASLELPRLAVADRQSAGRGRGQNAWWSPDGCLMFSLAWRPDRSSYSQGLDIQSRLSQLPLVVGISIASALSGLLDNRSSIKVKWPNDFYVDDKKLGGILIESVVSATEQFWIIGAGVNVLVDINSAPEPIRSNATSLHRVCTSNVRASLCLEWVLISIVQELQKTMELWQANGGLLQEQWPAHCMLTDRWVVIKQSDTNLCGICGGIDDRGALIIRDERGQQHAILSGVVHSWQKGRSHISKMDGHSSFGP